MNLAGPSTRGRFAAWALALLAMWALTLWASPASAHKVGLSRGEYLVEGDTIAATLVFARGEIMSMVSGLDQDANGELVPEEVAASEDAIARAVLGRVHISADGQPCAPKLRAVALEEEDGLSIEGRFTCKNPPRTLAFELAELLGELSRGHRHVAFTTVGSATVEHMTFRQQSAFRVHVESDAGEELEPQSSASVAWSYLLLGVEHIALGIDHLAFLFGLLLLGGRTKPMIVMITAFTLAHSVTLALAALDLFSLSPTIVEPAIALSVAYVGIENFVVKSSEKRWRITFPFGLVHGFGFAGVLGEIGLPKDHVVMGLATFNLGVELGQLALLALVFPIILQLRKYLWFRDQGVKALSAGLTLAGLAWFIVRVVGAL